VSFLAECIKENRAALKMSLQDVANAAGLTKAHVWELEQGNCSNPTVKSILGVATALQIDPSVLASLAMADLPR
jgi:transcriptional regulator with XRE-family HTH domain